MYFYSSSGKELVLVKEENGGIWNIRKRTSNLVKLKPANLEVIEPEKYNYWLDRLLKGESVPETNPSKLREPEVGKNYIIGQQVMRIETIIPEKAIIFSLVDGSLDGFNELSEQDAETLGVGWKEGLIPIATSTKLKEYDPTKKEFIPSDLSTYPLSTLEGAKSEIHHIILSLAGFKRTSDKNIIETPSGDLLDMESFIVTLGVRIKHPINPIGNSADYVKGEALEFSLITDPIKGFFKVDRDDLVDTSGRIHLIVRLAKEGHGINPLTLKDKSPGDVFEVTWDSAYSLKEQDTYNAKSRSCPDYEFQIFRKETSGLLFRTKVGRNYTKLIEK